MRSSRWTSPRRTLRMIKIRGLAHCSIAVSDLDVSRKFYTEVVGLELVHDVSAYGMVFLRAGSDQVVLARTDVPTLRSDADRRRAHHAFKIDPARYEDAKTFLRSQGVEIFEEEDRRKGVFVGRQFYFRDPDCSVIEFTEWNGTSNLE